MAAPIPREPPVTSATLPASFLAMFALIIFSFCSASVCCLLRRVVHLLNHLPPRFELAQYRVPCAAMLFRHNGTPASALFSGGGLGIELHQGVGAIASGPACLKLSGAEF